MLVPSYASVGRGVLSGIVRVALVILLVVTGTLLSEGWQWHTRMAVRMSAGSLGAPLVLWICAVRRVAGLSGRQ